MKNEAFIAWHGSPYTFDRFDFSKLRDGLGVFFTADKPHRHYIGIEVGNQMGDLVAHRIAAVINGEQGGISPNIGWSGGGNFAFYNYKG